MSASTLTVNRAHFEHVITLLRYVAVNLAESEAASADLIQSATDLLESGKSRSERSGTG